MSVTPTQTQASRDEEESLHYRAMARQLADMAMQMAERVLHDSKTSEPGLDHTERFERASRTVRRAILLARELAKPLPQPRQAPAQASDRITARKRIIREVEDAIDLKRRTDGANVESLEAELLDRLDRLDRLDIEADLATRTIEQIIADLARDLGVGFPLDETPRVWKRRTPEDVADLEARAAVPPGWVPQPTTSASVGHPSRPLASDPRRHDPQLPESTAEPVARGKIRDG